MDRNVEDILSLSLSEIVIKFKCPPEMSTYLNGAAFTRFNQSVAGDALSLFPSSDVSSAASNFIVNQSDNLFGVTSTSDWSYLAMSSSVPTPAGILLDHQQHTSSTKEQQEDMQRLKYYSYGIALPAICILGILGNVLNLIVLTRPTMRGPAYVYMRGNYITRPIRIQSHLSLRVKE